MDMDPQVKNRLAYVAMFALIMGSLALWGYVHVYSKSTEPSSFRSFSVSADGDAVAIPDVALFTFEIITEGGTDVADLQQENTQKTNDAIAFVKSKGVDAKDIATQGYTVEPRYQYFDCGPTPVYYEGGGVSGMAVPGVDHPCPPSEIVGYTVRTVVSVKVRNFKEAGNILSGVVQNGANSVSGLQFTVDDSAIVENEARAEAITKAKEKAQALANAGDFRLGRLLSISEGGGVTPFYDKRLYAEGMGGDMPIAAPVPTIEPGSQEFHVMMTLTYEIR